MQNSHSEVTEPESVLDGRIKVVNTFNEVLRDGGQRVPPFSWVKGKYKIRDLNSTDIKDIISIFKKMSSLGVDMTSQMGDYLSKIDLSSMGWQDQTIQDIRDLIKTQLNSAISTKVANGEKAKKDSSDDTYDSELKTLQDELDLLNEHNEIKFISSVKVIDTTKTLNVYTPNFAEIIEVILSWDFSKDDTILEFCNRYGLLGIVNWLEPCGEEVNYQDLFNLFINTSRIDTTIATETFKENIKNIKPGLLFTDDLLQAARIDISHGQNFMANINDKYKEDKGNTYPQGTDRYKWQAIFRSVAKRQILDRSDAMGSGSIKSNPSHEQFWESYREPLGLIRYLLNTIKLDLNIYLSQAKQEGCFLGYKGDGGIIAINGNTYVLADSLIQGIYRYLQARLLKGDMLQSCRGIKEFNCSFCKHGKKYFWPKKRLKPGGRNRVWGYNCNKYEAFRKKRERSGEAKRIPQRGRKKKSQTNPVT